MATWFIIIVYFIFCDVLPSHHSHHYQSWSLISIMTFIIIIIDMIIMIIMRQSRWRAKASCGQSWPLGRPWARMPSNSFSPYALQLRPYAFQFSPYAFELSLYAFEFNPCAFQFNSYGCSLVPYFWWISSWFMTNMIIMTIINIKTHTAIMIILIMVTVTIMLITATIRWEPDANVCVNWKS